MIINFDRIGQGGGSGSGSTVSWRQDLSAGTQIAQITINGTSQAVYAPEGGEGGEGYKYLPPVSFQEARDTAVSAGTSGFYYVQSGNSWMDYQMIEDVYGEGATIYPEKAKRVGSANIVINLQDREFYPYEPEERAEDPATRISISYNPEPEEGENHFSVSVRDDDLEASEIVEDGDSAVFHMYFYDALNDRFLNASGFCHYAFEYVEEWGGEFDVVYLDDITFEEGSAYNLGGVILDGEEQDNFYFANIPEGVYEITEFGYIYPENTLLTKQDIGAIDGDIATLSGVVQEQQIVFSSGYTELHTQVMELSGSTTASYYLNKMSQAQLAALYAELNVYRDDNNTPNVDEEEGYPAGKYRFFYYNNSNDEFKGYYELQLARFDGNPAIDFSANFQSRSNSIIFQKGFRLYPDGALEERLSNSAYLNPSVNAFGFGWGEYAPLKYDADNQQFLQGENETVLNPSGATYGVAGSDDINTILDNGGIAYFNDTKAFATPKYEFSLKENGVERKYQNPVIIREQITTKTVDGQNFSNKYSFIYTDYSGSRFAIKMALGDSNSQYATDFEYVDLI